MYIINTFNQGGKPSYDLGSLPWRRGFEWVGPGSRHARLEVISEQGDEFETRVRLSKGLFDILDAIGNDFPKAPAGWLDRGL